MELAIATIHSQELAIKFRNEVDGNFDRELWERATSKPLATPQEIKINIPTFYLERYHWLPNYNKIHTKYRTHHIHAVNHLSFEIG